MELYSTVAQMIPVFLLALLWESAYLDRLRTDDRPPRGDGRRGPFWTKPRVRVYILAVSTVVILALFVDVLVLADVLSDTAAARSIVIGGLALVMGTLLFRIWVDVLRATAPTAPDDQP